MLSITVKSFVCGFLVQNWYTGWSKLTRNLVKESFLPEVAETILNGFKMVLDVNDTIRIIGKTCFIKNKEHLSFETTYLPLLGKNGTIQHILVAYDYSFKL